MKTYSLDLQFVKHGGDQMPRRRHIAGVYVKTCTRSTNKGPSLITPDCTTLEELEYQIDRLHKELEIIRKEARTRFADAAKPN
jgi:hypothetical protein